MSRDRAYSTEIAELSYVARQLRGTIPFSSRPEGPVLLIGVGIPPEHIRFALLSLLLERTFIDIRRRIEIRSDVLRIPWGHLAIDDDGTRRLYDVKQTLLEMKVPETKNGSRSVYVAVPRLEEIGVDYCNWGWVFSRSSCRCLCSSTAESS